MTAYFFPAAAALLLSLLFTYLVLALALKTKVIDRPDGKRKFHEKPVPLLGGLAIFAAFFLILFLFHDRLILGILTYRQWWWFFAGAACLMVGGFLDDKFNLKPSRQIVWPLAAIACVLAGQIGIGKITNPFGGFLYFSALTSAIFTVIWLLAMMYTTKLLDGLDGLVTGISGIGGLIIFLFTVSSKYYQPDIAFAAIVFAAACLGFLFFNWYPAKIFLGEGGSLLLGYILGVLAIISGGKIAIALLVLGLPLLDFIWTIIRRLYAGKNPFRTADRAHLHYRLLDLGIGQRKTVLIFYGFSLLFGLGALFLQSLGKLIAVAVLFFAMIILILGLTIFSGDQET
ncbi:MAG TPA: MraY family glycosyltransferase [Candidatus Nanoarchaeia archaeon]|nr:MraY family glycosyltransferase [Candidatus Nanoarchaeia archaeon]